MADWADADLVALNDGLQELRRRLASEDKTRQLEATAIVDHFFQGLLVQNPNLFTDLVVRMLGNGESLPRVPGRTAIRLWTVIRGMLLEEGGHHVGTPLIWLMRAIRPRWEMACLGGSDAPPLSEVVETALAVVDGDHGDFCSFGAALIGKYGPEAAEYLSQLLERLHKYRTDCFRAPGLTWAVLQIAPAHADVLAIIRDIHTKRDSCPHSKEIAELFLKTNRLI